MGLCGCRAASNGSDGLAKSASSSRMLDVQPGSRIRRTFL